MFFNIYIKTERAMVYQFFFLYLNVHEIYLILKILMYKSLFSAVTQSRKTTLAVQMFCPIQFIQNNISEL